MLLAFEFRELDVADSGRSKDEQRCKNLLRKREKVKKEFFMFIVSSFAFIFMQLCDRRIFRVSAEEKCAIK